MSPTYPTQSYSLDDLKAGDVVFSQPTLLSILDLCSYQSLYVPGQIWETAKRLLALASYFEAYITQDRVMCMVEDNEQAAEFVSNNQFIDLNLSVLRVPNYSDFESLKKFRTDEDILVYEGFEGYLNRISPAKDEYETDIKTKTELFQKFMRGEGKINLVGENSVVTEVDPKEFFAGATEIQHETWESHVLKQAWGLTMTNIWSRTLGIPFYPNAVESSFCSPSILTALSRGKAADIALRLVEKSRFEHAKQNNDLLRRQVYDYQVPFIFGAILRQSDDWSDLPKIAKQMRETREAKAFREWSATVNSDLANFHRHFHDVEGLATELGKGIESREKNTLRLEFGNRKLLDIPFPIKRRRKGLHLVFLQNLFEWNRAIVNIDSELQRVLYKDLPEVELGLKMRTWSRGCKIKRDELKNAYTIEMQPIFSEENNSSRDASNETASKYETHIYGPVHGPVHTGSGDINIHTSDTKRED